MNKAEFLGELESRLRVLDKREIKDIVGEYAQHIDMKLASGLAEEEAIRDFGSLEELAAEILSAYHIDPAYDEKERTEKAKAEQTEAPPQADPQHKGAAYAAEAAKRTGGVLVVEASEAASAIGRGIKAAVGAVGRGIKSLFGLIGKGARAVWQGVCSICAFIGGLLVKAWQALTGTMEPQMVEVQAEDGTIYMAARPVKKEGLLPRLLKFLLYLAVAAAVLVALAPLTVIALLCVFGFGVTLVMQISGYPLLGPLLICLGAALMCVALWLFLASFLGRRRKEAAQ